MSDTAPTVDSHETSRVLYAVDRIATCVDPANIDLTGTVSLPVLLPVASTSARP